MVDVGGQGGRWCCWCRCHNHQSCRAPAAVASTSSRACGRTTELRGENQWITQRWRSLAQTRAREPKSLRNRYHMDWQ
ncbi:hypothetical protein BN13_30072 [Nostocoides jenkinsii Ben 74]|uniref:Uncharacterized protein n=1 Tax=Nostocoides jenkinsii Ben 74 TaxID=1193518 RepID=A0A077MB85_9MICO|nr:hypothetical protein BN13_30072 [Tetrasphaera jenkinsii Ben 74]